MHANGGIADEIEPIPDRGGGLTCPQCEGAMLHYGFLEKKEVFMDSCMRCSLVWFDEEELTAAAALHARSTSRHDDHLKECSERRAKDEALMRDLLARRRVRRIR